MSKKLIILFMALPLAAVSLGFDQLQDPQFYPDSNGKTGNSQKLEISPSRPVIKGDWDDEAAADDDDDVWGPSDSTTFASRGPQSNDVYSNGKKNNNQQNAEQRKKSTVKSPDDALNLDVHPEQADKYGVQEYSIIVTERGFRPAKLIVRKNIPVKLNLIASDSQNLCFIMKSDEYSFHKGVGSKQVETVSFRPTQVGSLKYYCPIHNLEGMLIVRD